VDECKPLPPPTHSADTTSKDPKRRMMPAPHESTARACGGWCYVQQVSAPQGSPILYQTLLSCTRMDCVQFPREKG